MEWVTFLGYNTCGMFQGEMVSDPSGQERVWKQ